MFRTLFKVTAYTLLFEMIRHAPRSQIAAALVALAALDVKITEILYFLLSFSPKDSDFAFLNALQDLSDHDNYLILLDLFKSHPLFASGSNIWIQCCTTGHLIEEVKKLSKKSSGWHGYATTATAEQFEEIDVADLALTAKNNAPALWDLVSQLFCINSSNSDHGDDSADDDIDGDEDNMMDLDEPDTPGPSNELIDSEYKIRELVCPLMTLLK